MKKNSNNCLLVLGIVLIISLIILSFVQSSKSQPHNEEDEETGWWDPREDYYNYSQSDRLKDFNSDYLIPIFLFVIFILAVIIWKVTHRTKERRYFSSEVKRQVLKNQNYKCAICKRSTGLWDYDHKNGDRSNNKLSNCQALCPNCHAKKTRGLLKNKGKSKLRILKIFVIIVVIIFFYYLFPILIEISQ